LPGSFSAGAKITIADFKTLRTLFMNEAVFSQISMAVLLTGLMVWMGFIVWDLAKKSKAGKFGTIMMFTIMGAGVLGFLIKTVLVEIIQL